MGVVHAACSRHTVPILPCYASLAPLKNTLSQQTMQAASGLARGSGAAAPSTAAQARRMGSVGARARTPLVASPAVVGPARARVSR